MPGRIRPGGYSPVNHYRELVRLFWPGAEWSAPGDRAISLFAGLRVLSRSPPPHRTHRHRERRDTNFAICPEQIGRPAPYEALRPHDRIARNHRPRLHANSAANRGSNAGEKPKHRNSRASRACGKNAVPRGFSRGLTKIQCESGDLQIPRVQIRQSLDLALPSNKNALRRDSAAISTSTGSVARVGRHRFAFRQNALRGPTARRREATKARNSRPITKAP